MQVNQKKIFNWESYFGLFSADFWFWAEVKKVTNRAKLKILLLELWLEPTRLGLITNKQAYNKYNVVRQWHHTVSIFGFGIG